MLTFNRDMNTWHCNEIKGMTIEVVAGCDDRHYWVIRENGITIPCTGTFASSKAAMDYARKLMDNRAKETALHPVEDEERYTLLEAAKALEMDTGKVIHGGDLISIPMTHESTMTADTIQSIYNALKREERETRRVEKLRVKPGLEGVDK